jgi:hypothetical protein
MEKNTKDKKYNNEFKTDNPILLEIGKVFMFKEKALMIFSHLNFNDVYFVSRVCKRWHRLSTDNYVWRKLLAKEFGKQKQ